MRLRAEPCLTLWIIITCIMHRLQLNMKHCNTAQQNDESQLVEERRAEEAQGEGRRRTQEIKLESCDYPDGGKPHLGNGRALPESRKDGASAFMSTAQHGILYRKSCFSLKCRLCTPGFGAFGCEVLAAHAQSRVSAAANCFQGHGRERQDGLE